VLDVNAVFRPQRATPHFGWERTRIAAKRLKLWACSRIRSTPVSIVITRYDLHLKDLRLRQTSPSAGNLVSLRKPDVFFPGNLSRFREKPLCALADDRITFPSSVKINNSSQHTWSRGSRTAPTAYHSCDSCNSPAESRAPSEQLNVLWPPAMVVAGIYSGL
jgi:hypothetical protein